MSSKSPQSSKPLISTPPPQQHTTNPLSPGSSLPTSPADFSNRNTRLTFLGLDETNNSIILSTKTFGKDQNPAEIRTMVTVEESGKALGRYKPRTRDGKRKQGFLNLNGFQMHQPTLRYRSDAVRTSSTLYGRTGVVSPYNLQAYIDPVVKKKFEEEQMRKKIEKQQQQQLQIKAKNSNNDNYQEEDEDDGDDDDDGPGSPIETKDLNDDSVVNAVVTVDNINEKNTKNSLTRFHLGDEDQDPNDLLEINGPSAPLLGPYYTSLFRDVCGIIGYDYTKHQLASITDSNNHSSDDSNNNNNNNNSSNTPISSSSTPLITHTPSNPQQSTLHSGNPSSRTRGSVDGRNSRELSNGGHGLDDDQPCPHATTTTTTANTSHNNHDNNSNLNKDNSTDSNYPISQPFTTRRTCRLCRIKSTQHERPMDVNAKPGILIDHEPQIQFSALAHRIRNIDFNANRAHLLKLTLSRGFALSILRHPQAVLIPTADYDTAPKWLWVDPDGVQLLWSEKAPVLDKKPNFFKKLFHLSNTQHTSSQELLRVDKVVLGIFQRGKNSHKKSVLKPWHCITIYFNNTQPKAEKSYDSSSGGDNAAHNFANNIEKLDILDPIEIVCHDDEQTRRIFMGLQALSPLSSSTKSYGSFLWKRASLKMRKLAFDKVLLKEEYLQQLWEQAKQFKYERFKKQYLLMKKVNALRFVIAQTSMLCASQIYYEFLNTLLTSPSTSKVLKLAATHVSAELSSGGGALGSPVQYNNGQSWVVRSKAQNGFFELDWGRLDQLIAMAANSIKASTHAIRQQRRKGLDGDVNDDNDEDESALDPEGKAIVIQQKDKIAKLKALWNIPADAILDNDEIIRILEKKTQIADLLEMCLVRLLPLNQSLSIREVVLARHFLKVYIRRRLVTSMIEKTHEVLTPDGFANERQTLRFNHAETPILFGVEPNQGQQVHLDSPALQKLSSIASINVTPLLEDGTISHPHSAMSFNSTTALITPPHDQLTILRDLRATTTQLPDLTTFQSTRLEPILSPGGIDLASPSMTLGDDIIVPTEDITSPPFSPAVGVDQNTTSLNNSHGIFEERKMVGNKSVEVKVTGASPLENALSTISTQTNINPTSPLHQPDGLSPLNSPMVEINSCDVVDAFNCGVNAQAEEIRQKKKEEYQQQQRKDQQALQQAQDFTNLEFAQQYNAEEYDNKVQLLRNRREKLKEQQRLTSSMKKDGKDNSSNPTDQDGNIPSSSLTLFTSASPASFSSSNLDALVLTPSANNHNDSVVLNEQQRLFLSQFPRDIINLVQEQISDLLDMEHCRLLPTADDLNPTPTMKYARLGVLSSSSSEGDDVMSRESGDLIKREGSNSMLLSTNAITTHNSNQINDNKLSIQFDNLPSELVGDTTPGMNNNTLLQKAAITTSSSQSSSSQNESTSYNNISPSQRNSSQSNNNNIPSQTGRLTTNLGPIVTTTSSPFPQTSSINSGNNPSAALVPPLVTRQSSLASTLQQHPERQKMMRQLQKLSYELQKQLTLDSTSYLAGVENDDDYGYSNHQESNAKFNPAEEDPDGTIPSYKNYLQLHRTRKESLAMVNASNSNNNGNLKVMNKHQLEEHQEKMRIQEERNQFIFQQQHPQQKTLNNGFNLALSTLQSKIGLDSHGLREYDLDSVEFLHHCYRFQLEQVNMGRLENNSGINSALHPSGPNQTKAQQLFEQGTTGASPQSYQLVSPHSKNSAVISHDDKSRECWMTNPQILKHRQLIKTNHKVIEFLAYLRAAMYPHLTGFEDELIRDGVVDLELLCGELLTLSPDTIDQLQNDQDGLGCNFIGFTRRK